MAALIGKGVLVGIGALIKNTYVRGAHIKRGARIGRSVLNLIVTVTASLKWDTNENSINVWL